LGAKWQKVKIEIPKEYSSEERQAIALEIRDFIVKRTQAKCLDKNNQKFAAYSEGYTKNLDFKIAGKSKGKVDLTLSGDMLGALDVLKTSKGAVTIGYENGSPENAKADGNIRGTYGNSKSVGPKRDFLGIHPSDLELILEKYPLDDSEERDGRVTAVLNKLDDQEED
jgi:hypothetical protein